MGISVLMSIYKKDNPVYLEQALKSIWYDQSLKPEEIVLVKDGELTDNLDSVVSKWKENLSHILKVVELSENVGLGRALNKGLKHCSSELVARMDADDISMAKRFERQYNVFNQNHDLDILGTWAMDIDDEGREMGMRKVPVNHQEIIQYIWTNPMLHPSVMFKLASIKKVGLYNNKMKKRQDYELWFRCAHRGLVFSNIAEPLLNYRFTEDWFKKNDIKVIWNQVKIGWKGCRLVKASPVAYLGVMFPLIKVLFPKKMGVWLSKITKKIDPRNKSE